MWQVEVIKINIHEMLSLDYRTYITSRIRLKSASCFSGLWIKTIPKHLVHTASKYFAISKFTLFFSRTYDHLCQSSLWSMQKFSADPDKLPVDFAKTSHTIDKTSTSYSESTLVGITMLTMRPKSQLIQ